MAPCACSSRSGMALSDQIVPDPTIIDPDNYSDEEAQPEVIVHVPLNHINFI